MAQLKNLIVNGVARIIGKLNATSIAGDGSEITNINANNISSGTLPVARGGTGAVDAATARGNLGITPANIGAATASHNQASNTITAMTGYSKASSAAAVSASDSLNTAIGKIEKALDGKQNTGSYAASSHTHDDRYYTESEIDTKLSGKANTSHGNHVPATETANNAKFLRNDNTWQTVTPANIGAAASSHTHDDRYYTESEINTKLNGKANSSHTHAAADITSVNASAITGVIASANLPSYVDDVLEYSAKANFPATGEAGKIYVDTATNLTYRWSGSAYVEISPSLALGETSSTAYRGDYGKTAYTHATSDTGKALTSGLYKITTSSRGHVTAGTAVAKADITALGIPGQDTVYTHPTTTGNKHIPAGGSSGQILRWSADGTAVWGADNNTTYSAGTGISLSGTTFSNSGVRSIATGGTNGTISVNTNGTSADVAVKGLGSAAYTNSDAYAASNHTHKYAGSSSAGGAANSSNAINVADTRSVNSAPNDSAFDKKQLTADFKQNSTIGSPPGFGGTFSGVLSFAPWSETSGGNGYQLAFGYNSNAHPRLAVRSADLSATSWGTWYKVYTSDDKPTLTELGAAASNHTHNYAGSSSAGGSATSAVKLDSSAGSATQPIYFKDGQPVATTYALNKTVPSDAKFTDTTYSTGNASTAGITKLYTGTGTATDGTMTQAAIKSALDGKAASSHGNHVPATETANNAKFLRNDNTWQTVTPANIGAAASSHTHNYAGSSSAGGSATSAVKLDTASAGSSTQPVYFSGGKPTACTSYANATVGTAKKSNSSVGFTTAGTGAAYTVTVDGIASLTAGVSFTMIPHTVSTTTAPTINVNELGAKNIRMRVSNSPSTTTVLAASDFLTANKPVELLYDGTYWIIDDMVRPNANALYGTVPVSSGGTGAVAKGATLLSNIGITSGTADPPATGVAGTIYIKYSS